jgi:hypothetical protein
MGNERRKSPREECDDRLSLSLDNRELEADLRNISIGGAFLHVIEKDSGKISPADTGQIVSFRLKRDKTHINYCGTINRYVEINDNKYLAVCFNEPTMDEFA